MPSLAATIYHSDPLNKLKEAYALTPAGLDQYPLAVLSGSASTPEHKPMNLLISWSEITADVSRKESYFLPLQHYLGAWFYRKNYGSGVRSLVIAFNCVGPLPGQYGPNRDYATGLLLEKKYYRARQEIIIAIKLNHKAVRRVTTQEAAAAILRDALFRVVQEVCTMNIPAFDCLAWEADLTAQVEGAAWLSGVLPQWQLNGDE